MSAEKEWGPPAILFPTYMYLFNTHCWHVRTVLYIKGTASRDCLCPVFFIKQLFLVPVSMPRTDLEFFSNICGVIHIRNRLPGNEYTGESIRIL
jgi:hypothetical protein